MNISTDIINTMISYPQSYQQMLITFYNRDILNEKKIQQQNKKYLAVLYSSSIIDLLSSVDKSVYKAEFL